jgi:predicted kinase
MHEWKANTLDWQDLDGTFRHRSDMAACIQDPVYHAEGDVWTHTKMVLAQLPNDANLVAKLTALYHDVAKPVTRVVEFDHDLGRERVGHPHHARRGAQIAWMDLWLQNIDLETRLAVYWQIAWHQAVFHLWTKPDMLKSALQYACNGSWQDLINFAKADNSGRISPNQQDTDDSLSLLAEWIAESDVNLKRFTSNHQRLFYFARKGRVPDYVPREPTGSRVIVLCGLPGSGKDTHLANSFSGLKVISLDNLRKEFKLAPSETTGELIQAAREQARQYLRAKIDFAWNAGNITKLNRAKIISLCQDYDAYISVHAFDRPFTTIFKQNAAREARVPEAVIHRMALHFEPPSLYEAHEVKWIT